MRIIKIPSRFQCYLDDLSRALQCPVELCFEKTGHTNIAAHWKIRVPEYFRKSIAEAKAVNIPRELLHYVAIVVRSSRMNEFIAGVSAQQETSTEELSSLALCAAMFNRNRAMLIDFLHEMKLVHFDLFRNSLHAQCVYWTRRSFPLVTALHGLCSTMSNGNSIEIQALHPADSSPNFSMRLFVKCTKFGRALEFTGRGIVPEFALWHVLTEYLKNEHPKIANEWEYVVASLHKTKTPARFCASLPEIISGRSVEIGLRRGDGDFPQFHAWMEFRESTVWDSIQSLYIPHETSNLSDPRDGKIYFEYAQIKKARAIDGLLANLHESFHGLLASHDIFHGSMYSRAKRKSCGKTTTSFQARTDQVKRENSIHNLVSTDSVLSQIEFAVAKEKQITHQLALDCLDGYCISLNSKSTGGETLLTATDHHHFPLRFICYNAVYQLCGLDAKHLYRQKLQPRGTKSYHMLCSQLIAESASTNVESAVQSVGGIFDLVHAVFGASTIIRVNGHEKIGYTVSCYVPYAFPNDEIPPGPLLRDLLDGERDAPSGAVFSTERAEGIGFGVGRTLKMAMENVGQNIVANLRLSHIAEMLSVDRTNRCLFYEKSHRSHVLPKPSQQTYGDLTPADPVAILHSNYTMEAMRRRAALHFNMGEPVREWWDGTTAMLTTTAGRMLFALRPVVASPIVGIMSCYLNLMHRCGDADPTPTKGILEWKAQYMRLFAFQFTPMDHLMRICEADLGLKVCAYTYKKIASDNFSIWISEVYLTNAMPSAEAHGIDSLWLASARSDCKRHSRHNAALVALQHHFPGSLSGQYSSWLTDDRYITRV
ncbi:hypothetical protein XU18_2896 [Perkinsela sp. CCAP 1560/4]|nr:hypothetical protein XU18_2896 [Perkinsela sp. CCAP 1560/4]|eukprot:KNH06391.1 hypothetical protein XU18_2896 [Perkinsela sp. CCAP 1560/4]